MLFFVPGAIFANGIGDSEMALLEGSEQVKNFYLLVGCCAIAGAVRATPLKFGLDYSSCWQPVISWII